MFRILLANLVVMVLPLLMFVVGVLLVAKVRSGAPGAVWRRYVGFSLLALPSGTLVYIMASVATAALRGDGHFYSVPFGGYSVSNNGAVAGSVLFWIGTYLSF